MTSFLGSTLLNSAQSNNIALFHVSVSVAVTSEGWLIDDEELLNRSYMHPHLRNRIHVVF